MEYKLQIPLTFHQLLELGHAVACDYTTTIDYGYRTPTTPTRQATNENCSTNQR